MASAHETTVKGVVDKYMTLRKVVKDYNRHLEAQLMAADNSSEDVIMGGL